MTRRCVCVVCVIAVAMATSEISTAGSPPPPPVSLGVSSQQAGPSRARVSARIAVHSERRGREQTRGHSEQISVRHDSGPGTDEPLYPGLPSSSPLLHDPHPFGSDSFWYSDGSGHVCIYKPGSVLPCFTVTAGGGGAPGGPGVNPAAIAAAIAARLELFPGR